MGGGGGGVIRDDLSNEGTCHTTTCEIEKCASAKNVRYIKETGELSMPAKSIQNLKRFGTLTLTQDGYFCMDIQDKGPF